MGYPPIQKIKEYRAQHGCSLREAVAALNSNREIAVDPRDAELSRLRAEVEILRGALEKLACRHVTVSPLWWQVEARKALEGGE